MPSIAEKRLCQCGKELCFTIDAKDATAFKALERKIVRCRDCGRIYGLDRFRELKRVEHPVTTKIRLRLSNVSMAQRRALRLAAQEGSLCFHRGRWAPPSRASGLPEDYLVDRPYEQSGSVFGLERRGLLQPDPTAERGRYPRPRVLTDAGRDFLRVLASETVTQVFRLSRIIQ